MLVCVVFRAIAAAFVSPEKVLRVLKEEKKRVDMSMDLNLGITRAGE